MATSAKFTSLLDWFIPKEYKRDENILKRVRLWVGVMFIVLFYTFYAVAQAITLDIRSMAVAVITGACIYAVLPFLLKAGVKYIILVHISLLCGLCDFCFGVYSSGGITSLVIIWLTTAPIMALMLTDLKNTIPYVIAVPIILIIFYLLNLNGYNFPHAIPAQNVPAANLFTAIGCMFILFLVVLNFDRANNRLIRLLESEKQKSDNLLLNILPAETAKELKERGHALAKHYGEVTVLFTDINRFTQLAEKLSPQELIEGIDECFKAIDGIMEKYGIEKIKTIGDAYMAAGGLPVPNKTNAADVVRAALDIQDFMNELKIRREAQGKEPFQLRIGIHTGPVVAGIVGIKKFQYDIWGDTVNTASRMESNCEVGKVNISQTTYELLNSSFHCNFRGEVDVKGKGKMKMYFVEYIDR